MFTPETSRRISASRRYIEPLHTDNVINGRSVNSLRRSTRNSEPKISINNNRHRRRIYAADNRSRIRKLSDDAGFYELKTTGRSRRSSRRGSRFIRYQSDSQV